MDSYSDSSTEDESDDNCTIESVLCIGEDINFMMDYDKRIRSIWDGPPNRDKKRRFVKVLLAHSRAKTYERAIKEWTELSQITDDICDSYCICSQKIRDNHFVYNGITGHELRIGSTCINKFGNDDLNGKVEVIDKIKGYLRDHTKDGVYEPKSKMCCCCLKYCVRTSDRSLLSKCDGCKVTNKTINKHYVELCTEICVDCNAIFSRGLGSKESRCQHCYHKKFSKVCVSCHQFYPNTRIEDQCEICITLKTCMWCRCVLQPEEGGVCCNTCYRKMYSKKCIVCGNFCSNIRMEDRCVNCPKRLCYVCRRDISSSPSNYRYCYSCFPNNM